MDKIINCKSLSEILKEKCRDEIIKINDKLKLTVISVGKNPASVIYINKKRKACNELNIDFEEINFEENVSELELINKINELNNDKKVTGILVQLPLPENINKNNVINAIDYKKDVDGLTDYNTGKLYNNENCIIPCTAKGILEIFKYLDINLQGKNIAIINRSKLVGKPLIPLLINKNATVSVCHSKTNNLKAYTKKSDIIICAVGIPKFLKRNMIKKGCILIVVGISKINDKIYGDVDFKNVLSKVRYITPVPGGVGLMTVASLLSNVIECYKLNNNS